MSSQKIQLGDIGTSIRIRVQEDNANVDVSLATSMQIFLKKPGGTTLVKIASFVTDGVDGLIHYISVSGDIDEIGTWKTQGFVELSQGDFFTEVASFKVNRNI